VLRAVLIAASLAVAMPCFAQQVRVIKGDIEHVYGPSGELLDDGDLQARNERAFEHMQAENELAIARRRVKVEIEYLRLNRTIARMGNYGGWVIGPPRASRRGEAISRRTGISPSVAHHSPEAHHAEICIQVAIRCRSHFRI
jgi:hypothetical protein